MNYSPEDAITTNKCNFPLDNSNQRHPEKEGKQQERPLEAAAAPDPNDRQLSGERE